MREPLHCGTSNRTGSTFFVYGYLCENTGSNGVGWQQLYGLADMLDIIQNNPYRLLGIYSNSPTRERVANHNRLKAFLKVGKAVSFPLDLPSFLPPIERTAETVTEADAKLTLPNEQLRYAQFWFIKVTPMDDIAMNHLIAGDMKNARSIWARKVTVSSLQNRMICALMQDNYRVALTYADKLYSSYISDFAAIVLGENHTATTERLAYIFLDELCSAVGSQQVLPYIANNAWRQYVRNKSIRPLIETLRAAIETAKASRGKGIGARLAAGTKLMNETMEALSQLKILFSDTDLQYQMIADKLGLEILQCGIDYYNGSEAADAAYKAMKLQSYALSVVVGQMAKDRCQENVNILQKIIDNLPPQMVFAEDKAIQKELQKYCQLPDKICHAVTLLNNTKAHLLSMKSKLGGENAYYLKTSTQVVGNALHNVIEEVNAVQKDETIEYHGRQIPVSMLFDREAKIAQIKSVLREAWKAIQIMDTFDMESNFKYNRYNVNRSTLKSICEQIGMNTSYMSQTSTSPYATASHSSSARTTSTQTNSHSTSSNNTGCVFSILCIVIGAVIGVAIAGFGGATVGAFAGLGIYEKIIS